jgi:simple sugar transport system ATP-binding protein
MPFVELRAISKTYVEGTPPANDRVDLDIDLGRIHALIGENGTGKSTLMHVLAGVVQPDAGTIRIDGHSVTIRSPREAAKLGVGMIHQTVPVIRRLSVIENLFLGIEAAVPVPRSLAASAPAFEALASRLGITIDPNRLAEELTESQLQKVALMSVLLRSPRVVILDEPTATFTRAESELLHTLMRDMAREGRAVVFITHKLHDALAVADVVSVLRRGRLVATQNAHAVDADRLAKLMFGTPARQNPPAGDARDDTPGHGPHTDTGARADRSGEDPPSTPGECRWESPRRIGGEACRLQNASLRRDGRTLLRGVTMTARFGEILAVTGIREHGLEALEDLLCGETPPSSGLVTIHGVPSGSLNPLTYRLAGHAYVPSDRRGR